MEGIFSLDPASPPHLSGNSSQASYIYFNKFLGLLEPPIPKEFPVPSVEGIWIFSGTTH